MAPLGVALSPIFVQTLGCFNFAFSLSRQFCGFTKDIYHKRDTRRKDDERHIIHAVKNRATLS